MSDIYDRVKVFVEHLKNLCLIGNKEENREKKVLVVSHGGWISSFYKLCHEFYKGPGSWGTPKNCHLHVFFMSKELNLVNLESNVDFKKFKI